VDYCLLPQFLQYELTYACNSSCTFCYNPSHRGLPDESTRIAVLRALNRYRLRHVQLIGGEVTLLKDLPHYLDQLHDVQWRSLVTNGRIFVSELAGRVNEVYLSLHGTPEVHEAMTKAPGSFEIISASIENYVRLGITVHSDTVLSRVNASLMYEVARRASNLGMHTLYVNIFQPAGLGFQFADDLAPSNEQIKDAITQLLQARQDFKLFIKFGTSTPFCLDERLITEGLAFRCGAGDWFASFNPWGELRICNQSARSYGNILELPLHEIWHSKDINREYRSLQWLEEPCRSCPVVSSCLGGCRISDSGKPRIDPLVVRDKQFLLSHQQLATLKDQIGSTAYR